MSDIIQILRKNHLKKNGGLSISSNISCDVVAIVHKNGIDKYIENDENSLEKAFSIVSKEYYIIPHIPLCKQRYIIFISGAGGMGKSSLASLFCKQTHKHITKKVFYICGTDITSDENLSKLSYIRQIDGEILNEIDIERDLNDSLLIFDDIDNWTYHKEAIKVLNKAYECGRKFGINIIYISHITSKASESKIYGEVDMYITNCAKNNRMFETHLNLKKNDIEEISTYLDKDCFVCYNKLYDAVITDKKIYKLN